MSFTALNFKEKEFKLKCSHKALAMIQSHYGVYNVSEIFNTISDLVNKAEIDYILFAFLQSFHKEDFAEIEKVKSFFFDEDSDLKEYFESVKILLEGIQSEFYRSLGNADNTNSTEVKETKSKKKTLP